MTAAATIAVSFRAFEPGDFLRLQVQPSQSMGLDAGLLDLDDARDLAAHGQAWTAIDGDGRLLCCAGFREIYAGRHAIAWALLAEGLGAAHLAITRFARARIAESPLVRIEAVVRANVPAEPAWARVVGLGLEARLAAWGATSEDHLLFSRVNR